MSNSVSKKPAIFICKIYAIFYVCAAFFLISNVSTLYAANSPENIVVHESKQHDGLYYIQCKKTGLFIVLEKIAQKNINEWVGFAKRQEYIYGRALNKYATKKTLPNLNGIAPFKNRLLNYEAEQLSKRKHDYDMYASYLMHANPEESDNTQKFGTMTSVENSSIAMVTTVQISKNYNFYSALGISRTVDEAVRISKSGKKIKMTNLNSMPMHIYTYTYYILKKNYPNVEGMISTPVLAVRKIFQKFIPKEFITIGAVLANDFSKLAWVKQNPSVFAHSMPSEPDFFKGAVMTKINGQACLDYLKNNFNIS